jgi:hypothetical protein
MPAAPLPQGPFAPPAAAAPPPPAPPPPPPPRRRSDTAIFEFCTKHVDACLAAFLEEAKAGIMKLIRKLGTDSPGPLYGARKVWDHPIQRTRYVRVMGSETADGHEAWLTLWNKDPEETETIEHGVWLLDEWTKREVDVEGVLYERGPVVLGFDHEESTLSLIYRERQGKPFTRETYCGHIIGLFGLLASMLSRKQRGEAEAALKVSLPVAEVVEVDEGPAEGETKTYDGAASLVRALEAGEVDIYKRRQPIRVGKHDGDVTVADDIKGKKIVVSIVGVERPSKSALTSILSDLGDPKVAVKYVPGAGVLIRKVFRRMPSTSAIGAAVEYAAKFAERADQLPKEPRTGEEGDAPRTPAPQAGAPGRGTSS